MIDLVSRTRAVITASLLVSALATGGCSDDEPTPQHAPTPSASAPSDKSAEVLPSASPAELDEKSAKDFVGDWFGEFSRAMSTGEVSPVEELSASSCKSCRALAEQVESVYDRGGMLETDGWTVEAIRRTGEFTERPTFVLRVRQSARTLYDGNSVVDRAPPTKVPMSVTVVATDGEWRMGQLVILE